MTDERLAAMKAAAQDVFSAALQERGTDPSRFELLLHVDELVGPMAFVVALLATSSVSGLAVGQLTVARTLPVSQMNTVVSFAPAHARW